MDDLLDDNFKEVADSEFELPADMVLLAMGFVAPINKGLADDLDIETDPKRGNVLADDRTYQTNRKKVFTAGDMRRGQSLVVWAIREGRQAAHSIDAFLMGTSDLPR